MPEWVKRHRQWREWWRKPWTVPLESNRAVTFKKRLWNHGLVSPNFTRKEMGGELRHSLGCPVPEALRSHCQRHAFTLERVRHACGDQSMSPLSAYRCGPHNSAVGGVSNSQHLRALATDWDDATRARLGPRRFDKAMHYHFRNGGRGVVGNTSHIRHVDNGPRRTWSY